MILSAPRRSIHSRAEHKHGRGRKLGQEHQTQQQSEPECLFQVGCARQRTSAHAVAKINNVAAPSVAAIEKCAISEGENANRASAKFAAVRENNRSAARQTSQASNRPEQDIHGARPPGQRYRIGRNAGDAK